MTAAEQRAALAELRRLAEEAEDALGYFRRYGGFTARGRAQVAQRVLTDAVQVAIPWLLDAAERGLEQDSFPVRVVRDSRRTDAEAED